MVNSSSSNSWFTAVKRAFRSSPSGDGNDKKPEGKKRGGGNWRDWLYTSRKNYYLETKTVISKEGEAEDGTETAAIAVAMATTAAAQAAVKTAQAAVEVIRISVFAREKRAAVIIQSFFRGFLARQALVALKGVVRLQALIRGYNVRKRAKMTLQCIQSLVRVQAQVCNQRRRLSCEAATPLSPATARRKSIYTNASRLGPFSPKVAERNEDTNILEMKNIRVPLRRHSFALSESEDFLDPKTPSSCRVKSIQVRSCSPRNHEVVGEIGTPSSWLFYSPRTSLSENSYCFSRPNYMAATASATARAKSNGVSRFQASSPARDQVNSAKKRLLFPA